MQRLAGYLGDRVPDRDLDRADADGALAVSAGLFALHHRGQNLSRIEILLVFVQQGLRIGAEDARDEAGAHPRPAGIAAGRVEGETGDRFAVEHHVGEDRDD